MPRKPKTEVPMEAAMKATGFSSRAAKEINDSWARFGITGVRVGSTVLKVTPKAPVKVTPRRRSKFDLKGACYEVIEKLREVAGKGRDVYLPEIPEIFAKLPYAPDERSMIFTELDERPGQFGGSTYFDWHAPLRQVRNHSVHGQRLFGAIRGEP